MRHAVNDIRQSSSQSARQIPGSCLSVRASGQNNPKDSNTRGRRGLQILFDREYHMSQTAFNWSCDSAQSSKDARKKNRKLVVLAHLYPQNSTFGLHWRSKEVMQSTCRVQWK